MVEPALRPWEKLTITKEQEQALYRDWGLYFTRGQQLDTAAKYYDKSLQLKEDDTRALLSRSKCKRSIAQNHSALADSMAAQAINARNAPINHEVCAGLYELNEFEDCKRHLHNNTRLFKGNKVKAFADHLVVVDGNLQDSLGESVVPFLLKNQQSMIRVAEEIEKEKNVETRPLWKVMKEEGKCDVLSVIEKEEDHLHPRELARRERSARVLDQIYFNRAWTDIQFLKKLREDPSLLLERCKASFPVLKEMISSKYYVTKTFEKMLQARSPQYNELYRKCPKKEVCDRHRENTLYRVQYQTRRNVNAYLREIKRLREKRDLTTLTKFVESIMGDYIVLKTYRVLPWQLEFMYEVYNTLGLAHVDRCIVPPNFFQSRERQQLRNLLNLPSDKTKDRIVSFVFGDRSTFKEPDALDPAQVKNKKLIDRLEKRMRFAKHGIERSYIYHEIARNHLKQSRFDECCSFARKSIEEAKGINSNLWQFLGNLLIVKSHAFLGKLERIKDVLEECMKLAQRLRHPPLTEFVQACITVNDEHLSLKRRTYSQDSVRSAKSMESSKGSSGSLKRLQKVEEEEDEDGDAGDKKDNAKKPKARDGRRGSKRASARSSRMKLVRSKTRISDADASIPDGSLMHVNDLQSLQDVPPNDKTSDNYFRRERHYTARHCSSSSKIAHQQGEKRTSRNQTPINSDHEDDTWCRRKSSLSNPGAGICERPKKFKSSGEDSKSNQGTPRTSVLSQKEKRKSKRRSSSKRGSNSKRDSKASRKSKTGKGSVASKKAGKKEK